MLPQVGPSKLVEASTKRCFIQQVSQPQVCGKIKGVNQLVCVCVCVLVELRFHQQ